MIICLRKLNKSLLSVSISPLRRKLYPPKPGTKKFSRAFSAAASNADTSVFPWRHDSMLPERVLQHNEYSGAFNPTNRDPPIIRKLIAARELNISAWDVMPIPFYKHEWETELTTNFAVAFEFAMAELLRTVFRVPVANEDGTITINSSAGSDLINDANVEEMSSTHDNEYLKGMMDKKLLQKYFSLNPENMHLKFILRPVEAKLQSMFAVPVPGLTREIVEHDPYIRGAIYRLHSAYEETGFDEHYFDLLSDFARNGADKRTVIAEAAIRCMEFFQIKDASTGQVVQGMEDGSEEEEAVHIVRFEVVTDGSQDGEERKIGNWKITDVDDLLEGNVFH